MPPRAGEDPEAFATRLGRWISLGLALAALTRIGVLADDPARPSIPTLWLIGDSTVKNGRGDGAGGLWGWGQVLETHFDASRIRVVNRALGGRSSRTFLTEGLWARVLDELRPGDFVLMQFGHNDGGELFRGTRPRASLKGNGEETTAGTVEQTGREEIVHTYGWYLRRYIAETWSRGATPIVLSPVPRNIWREGKVARAAHDYGRWAAEAAAMGHAFSVDLNERIARRYEADGEARVSSEYFTDQDHTHTSRTGAEVNATCVAQALRALEDCELREFLVPASASAHDQVSAGFFRFDFGGGNPAAGFLPVGPDQAFSEASGYGLFPPSDSVKVARGNAGSAEDTCLTADGPFYFSVAVPEGNYRVTLILGDPEGPSSTTVKAESRQLMLEQVTTRPGERLRRSFTVNVRTPRLPDGGTVRLKERERPYLHWDDKLTLEFNGSRPCVAAVIVEPEPNATTVYLAGDSTVTDQPHEPWNSWGQMLPRFFQPGVAVANHAESGESIRSSLGAQRFDKIFSTLRKGDYLFLQFGHNDMKDRAPMALETYRTNLSALVRTTREHGGIPVLVTSMERKAGVERDTLGDYPRVVREVAAAEGVALIDLHAVSKILYRALGDRLDAAFQDGTHHNNYGSYLLARCVVEGIRKAGPDLADQLVEGLPPFSPATPPAIADVAVPASPQTDLRQPDGR